MKIFAYEVRPDEEALFQKYKERYDLELGLSPEIPSLETAALCAGCEGVTTLGQGHIDRTLLERFCSLGVRYLSTRTIGYDHIDVAAAKDLGIRVSNAGYPPDTVAEYTVMLMLMCLRHYKPSLWRAQVNDFSLDGLQGKELRSMTVGIIGTGRIGMRVAQILAGFGCRTLGCSPHPKAGETVLEYVDLNTIYSQCDIITLHAALNESTYHMINEHSISKMRNGVILINCARGALMDTEAVTNAIEGGKIGGLGIDSLEHEEGIFHTNHRDTILSNRSMAYLRQFPNVVMTPHMAFYTDQAVESMVRYGVEGLLSMAQTGTFSHML